ncbi:MAG: type II toxin-antitoxin system VapC family toxin [Thermoproteota archaeon]
MNWVLDSNILVKLVLTEPGSHQARQTVTRTVKQGSLLYTVDLALAESLNALWKHVNIHEDLTPEEGHSAAQDLKEIYSKLNILTTQELCKAALNLALTHKITIYDSLYLTATQKLNSTLYTADRKLHTASKNTVPSKLLKTKPQTNKEKTR